MSFYKFVVGDFNGKLGKDTQEEYRIGRFGLGDQNENGNRLGKEQLLSATEEKRSRLRRLRTRGLLVPRKALQEDLSKYRQKILEAAQARTSLKKCRRDLCEYNTPLVALLREDGTRTSSRREMEIITERFYSNLFRSSTPVSSPTIPTGEAPPRILPSELRVAIKSMKPGTAPDLILFLRAGGHPLHVILAVQMTFYLQKERIPDQWKTSRTVIIVQCAWCSKPRRLCNYCHSDNHRTALCILPERMRDYYQEYDELCEELETCEDYCEPSISGAAEHHGGDRQ
ncbi:hypothetical protein RB195_024175 [Necator americanus]|uniref:Uncharacterized protein n=1 Tax=Necator americanus TaxID=51031 RepID=A0ABR1EPD4_NECAM